MTSPERVKVDLPGPVHRRLILLAAQMRQQKGRQVTIGEVIETALERAGLAEDQEAGA